MTSQESLCGFVYLAFQLLLLPQLLFYGNSQLHPPLSEAELNFAFYLLNFLCMLFLFHRFLGQSLSQAVGHPVMLCQAVVLGLAAYFACNIVSTKLVELLIPSFRNLNNASMDTMQRSSFFLMAIGTVILVPPYEECIYRGLIFRSLYQKSPVAAYLISMLAFAAIHVMGYLGQYSPMHLAIATFQYLPAGLCLAWAYQKTDTIFAPILIHAIINYVTITGMR